MLAENMGAHYHLVKIPRPGREPRVLSVPCPRLKRVQRRCLVFLSRSVPLHKSAVGGVQARSLLNHARPHCKSEWVVTADIVRFFDNVHHRRVEASLARQLADRELAAQLAFLTTYRRCLPQGAPTSTFLGNMVLFGLDRRLHRFAARHDARYTRFVDDLAMSTKRPLRGLTGAIVHYVESYGFRVSPSKTKEQSRAQPQVVCGLVVNDAITITEALRAQVRSECTALRDARSELEVSTLSDRLRGYCSYLSRLDVALAGEVRVVLAKFGETPVRRRVLLRLETSCAGCG